MVATLDNGVKTPRLTLAVEQIAEKTQTIRSLDWDRSRFDIEFGLQWNDL